MVTSCSKNYASTVDIVPMYALEIYCDVYCLSSTPNVSAIFPLLMELFNMKFLHKTDSVSTIMAHICFTKMAHDNFLKMNALFYF